MLENPKRQAARPTAALSRIATLLGCDVETFTHRKPGPADLEGIEELLRLWAEIDDPEKRAELLEFARQCAKSA